MKLSKMILVFWERETNGRPVIVASHTTSKWTALVQFRYFYNTMGERVRRVHSPVKLKKHLDIQNKPGKVYSASVDSIQYEF